MKLLTLIYLLPAFADITLTNADNAKTINASLGDKIIIKLTADNTANGPKYSWSAPTSSNTKILTKSSSAAAQNGDATGTFTVNEEGTAELNSGKSCKAASNQKCPQTVLSWKVTIKSG
jgi:predicted secreted protein